MSTEKDTTRSLSKILEKVRTSQDAERFITDHTKRKQTMFYQYINALIAEKNIPLPEVVSNSGISKNYIYNILSTVLVKIPAEIKSLPSALVPKLITLSSSVLRSLPMFLRSTQNPSAMPESQSL